MYQLGAGKKKFDVKKVAEAAANVAAQTLTFGADGYSGAIAAFFSSVEALRGSDNPELKATNLVFQTLAYGLGDLFAVARFQKLPTKKEAATIVKAYLERGAVLVNQQEVHLKPEHISKPTRLLLFKDAINRIYYDIKVFKPVLDEKELQAQFSQSLENGLSRLITRQPEYFSPILDALTGPLAENTKRNEAWLRYRSELINGFEEATLFGQDELTGPRLSEVYLPLRCWWEEENKRRVAAGRLDVYETREKINKHPNTAHVCMLHAEVLRWLEEGNDKNRIKLISGGPGSGKSTFAKYLASYLAVQQKWRPVLIPLQRISLEGQFENELDDFLRRTSAAFDADARPILGQVDSDNSRTWVFIFDGLDELAKEGTESENAAQIFASVLNTWQSQLPTNARLKILVLGRAPSMQSARERLALGGQGTLYVEDMLPKDSLFAVRDRHMLEISDPDGLLNEDQRSSFWARWAIATGSDPEKVPEALEVKELEDLSAEPLLAYLLIYSGYVEENWEEAADNRNKIYDAIFEKIWQRERIKPTRQNLNDLGPTGFSSVMDALGIAAWRGGGRTGDEETFKKVCKISMSPKIHEKARKCNFLGLDNVALLFYTQRDEDGGRGYEFLHKSFGEYLTSRGLVSLFVRLGRQVIDDDIEFSPDDFFERWAALTGPNPMTDEIANFIMNEMRLLSSEENSEKPWLEARQWIPAISKLVDKALIDGLPVHRLRSNDTWREVETNQRNAEAALLAILDACGRTAYPAELFNKKASNGGWKSGPIILKSVFSNPSIIASLEMRSIQYDSITPASLFRSWRSETGDYPMRLTESIVHRSMSRLKHSSFLSLVTNYGSGSWDLEGSSIIGAQLRGNYDDVRFSLSDMSKSNLEHTSFYRCVFERSNFSNSRWIAVQFFASEFKSANCTKVYSTNSRFDRCKFTGANLREARFGNGTFNSVIFKNCNLTNADFSKASFKDVEVTGCKTDGATFGKNTFKRS